jgi:ribokinase
MTKSRRICVVGSANVDLTFCTPRLPRAGETVAGRALHVGMGGKGANQAVAAARLGADVAFVACVGNDAFGTEAIGHYQAEGIDVSLIRQDPTRPTGTAAILLDDEAENYIIVVAGANAGLTVEDVKNASRAITQADALLCQLETPIAATVEAFCIAHAAGRLTVLTPAPVTELPDELLRHCDLCVLNRTEMESLANCTVDSLESAHAAARLLRARGVRFVALTMGANGAILVDDAGAAHIPAVSVEAVDTTGAGDAYSAGLAVSLACGLDLREAARRASMVAAITVTRIGTQTAFPRRTEVDERLSGAIALA